MKIISTDKMPTPGGHYSMCIEHNGCLYLAGQLPKNPVTKTIPEGIEAQTIQVLENIKLIIEEAGSSMEKIIQMRIYIPNIELWDAVNKVYSTFFPVHKPVRAVIPTRELHYGCLLEVEVTAAI
jgi:reactive intermediate/imine deaminase